LLEKADLTIVNGEGVISSGGQFTDKGEPIPYMYRAHPKAVDVLKDLGIDVVVVGNNHVGDYGRVALGEMLDRLTTAGIAYAGGGLDLKDASRPAYRVVGDTVVAVVGGDLTMAPGTPATPDSPGTYFHADAHLDNNEDELVEKLTGILAEARKHAHVVLFSPHWGRNWKKKPTKPLRSLAKRLIKAGYDAILGHSSHLFHGVELIDGKPVIYDSGNVFLDYGGGHEAHRDTLWELKVNRAGVVGIVGYPLRLKKNRTQLAKDKERDEILETLKKRSKEMGTKLVIRDGVATAKCDPGEIKGPKGTPEPPKRPVPEKIRLAPSDAIIDALPAGVEKVNIEYEEGIRLIGYKLVNDEIQSPHGGQVVILYFTTDQKVKNSYSVHLESRGLDKKTDKPRKGYASHLPGDWLWPTDRWPVGKVIQDWTMFRLKVKPEGKVDFYVGLHRRKMVTPKSSDKPLVDGALLHLGSSVYKRDAQHIFEVLNAYREATAGKTKEGE
jgi:poly-gamma-glutamate synthesis protein (capsule biosynthesis protein)